MGSKLGTILSLIFAVFVFIFATDLITLQANYSNLESIANSVGLLISESGGAAIFQINSIIRDNPGVEITYDNAVFQDGDFKQFILTKEFKGVIIFNEAININVKRTVLIGQFEGIY